MPSAQLELVSLHIPKTAGTSLRGILHAQFGQGLVKLDVFDSGRCNLNDLQWTNPALPQHAKAVHGHFKYHAVGHLLPAPDQVPWMTWLRNPAERVISNYFFLRQVIETRLSELPDENLWVRMGKSLEEFMVVEANRNVQSAFLADAPLEAFAFVGLQDAFEEELTAMADALGWKPVRNRLDNTTPNKPSKVDSGLRRAIEELNSHDMELYERALTLKRQRTKYRQP